MEKQKTKRNQNEELKQKTEREVTARLKQKARLEQKVILEQKLKEQQQKSRRTEVLHALPKPLSDVMEGSAFIISPERERILEAVHAKWNNDLHKHDFAKRYSRFRQEFSWEHEVMAYVKGTTLNFARQPAYLYFGLANCPLFVVDGNWAIQHFSQLWTSIHCEDWWLFCPDLSCGVLISRYGGYLEHDPNPEEILYAVTVWGNIEEAW